MKMHYCGVWSPNGPAMKIEIDETDSDEIADIHARMNNQTDEKIREEVVSYLKNDERRHRYAKDNPPPKLRLIWDKEKGAWA